MGSANVVRGVRCCRGPVLPSRSSYTVLVLMSRCGCGLDHWFDAGEWVRDGRVQSTARRMVLFVAGNEELIHHEQRIGFCRRSWGVSDFVCIMNERPARVRHDCRSGSTELIVPGAYLLNPELR